MIRRGSDKNWSQFWPCFDLIKSLQNFAIMKLRLGGLPSVEPIYWRKWVFPTKKKCSGAQGRRWSIARSPLDNSCLRRTPDFSLKATVKIYHIDVLLSDISSRISCKNLSLQAMNLIPEKNTFMGLRIWIWKYLFQEAIFQRIRGKNGDHATSRFTILSHSCWHKIEEICGIIIFFSSRAPLSPIIQIWCWERSFFYRSRLIFLQLIQKHQLQFKLQKTPGQFGQSCIWKSHLCTSKLNKDKTQHWSSFLRSAWASHAYRGDA